MLSFRSWIDPGGRWLARHLARLRENLEVVVPNACVERLRRLSATRVASAVREMVHSLLDETSHSLSRSTLALLHQRPCGRTRGWKTGTNTTRGAKLPYESEPAEELDSPTPAEVQTHRFGSSGVGRSGCRFAGSGVVASSACQRVVVGDRCRCRCRGDTGWLCGRTVGAGGWGLARSALVLLSLADTVHGGAATLAAFSNG